MDLFGDLPSVKNPKKRAETSTNEPPKDSDHANAGIVDKNEKKPRLSAGFSLVGTVGTAGTTMAFVPTALRKPAAANVPTGSGQKTKSATVSSAAKSVTDATIMVAVGTGGNLSVDNSVVDEGAKQEGESSIVDETRSVQEEQERSAGESEELRMLHASVTDPYDPFQPNDYLQYRDEKRRERERQELEEATREALRQQQLMREQIAEERRKMIECGDYQRVIQSVTSRHAEDSGATPDTAVFGGVEPDAEGVGRGRGRGLRNLPAWLLQKQQEEAEVGSKVPQQHSSTGPVAESVSESMRMGRGRGRGFSNLPAWLVQKQQEEGGSSSFIPQPGQSASTAQFQTATTGHAELRLVVLSNMTAPGEADDELPDEVKEECEIHCGPVEGSIIVKDADASYPQVRVFVLFQQAGDAQKASKLFHGRSFGGRQISASLLDARAMDSL